MAADKEGTEERGSGGILYIYMYMHANLSKQNLTIGHVLEVEPIQHLRDDAEASLASMQPWSELEEQI